MLLLIFLQIFLLVVGPALGHVLPSVSSLATDIISLNESLAATVGPALLSASSLATEIISLDESLAATLGQESPSTSSPSSDVAFRNSILAATLGHELPSISSFQSVAGSHNKSLVRRAVTPDFQVHDTDQQLRQTHFDQLQQGFTDALIMASVTALTFSPEDDAFKRYFEEDDADFVRGIFIPFLPQSEARSTNNGPQASSMQLRTFPHARLPSPTT